MEKTFDLVKLIEFLHQTLILTEMVKSVLKSDCEEATYCLKSWYIEANSQQKLTKDVVCTCPNLKNEVEEIAAGISRTLLQTQELRTKLSLNIKNSKRGNSKCLSMYESSKETANKKQKNIKNVCPKQDLKEIKANTQKMSIRKGSQTKVVREDTDAANKKTKNDDKQQPVKLSGPKNFLAINKRNIKNMKEVKQCRDNAQKPGTSVMQAKCVTFGERHSVASTSELKSLIEKISSTSSDKTSDECVKCPLHGDVNSRSSSKQNLTRIDIVDNFNTADIPHEIIKPLNIYHTYLNIEHSEKPVNGKRQKAVREFLVQFNKMDNIVQQKLVDKKNFATTSFFKFMSLFQTLLSQNVEPTNLIKFKKLYTELSSAWKTYEDKEFDSKELFRNDDLETPYISSFIGYMSNGIWNFSCAKNFEGISKVCCIRYTNISQLLLFFDTIQQLQYLQHYKDLIKIIVEEVFPIVNDFDASQLEYAKIYKMIFILYQGLNPKLPVLIRTDE